MTNKPNRLLELDSLRGFAAIFVVFFHLTMGSKRGELGFKFGITGVDLFFIISGFVIFLTLEKTKTYKDFLVSRFARLFPSYWMCVTITTILTIGWKVVVKMPLTFPTPTDYLANMTMTQYYWGIKDIDGPYWTLLIELLFYCLMLVVFVFNKLQKIEIIGVIILVICFLFGTVSQQAALPVYRFIYAYIPLLKYFPLFFAGIIFYRIKFHEKTTMRYFIILLCYIAQLGVFNQGRIVNHLMSIYQYGAIIFVYFTLFILYCNNLLHFIVNRVTLFLGKISYSLYLIHQYISVNLLLPLFTHSKYFHFNFWVVVFFIVLPVVITIATLLNRFIEIPINRYLKGKLNPKQIPVST